ncbi:unnamed protein product [Paramecium octaurelia]|uniref:Transmembrane protein n=1 Tax=Paramecium octaurelia TaxID=43137 RepID=A0A8S1SLX6_PAROT|nr:unnamed protein product [Paramecium octaurelia]
MEQEDQQQLTKHKVLDTDQAIFQCFSQLLQPQLFAQVQQFGCVWIDLYSIINQNNQLYLQLIYIMNDNKERQRSIKINNQYENDENELLQFEDNQKEIQTDKSTFIIRIVSIILIILYVTGAIVSIFIES